MAVGGTAGGRGRAPPLEERENAGADALRGECVCQKHRSRRGFLGGPAGEEGRRSLRLGRRCDASNMTGTAAHQTSGARSTCAARRISRGEHPGRKWEPNPGKRPRASDLTDQRAAAVGVLPASCTEKAAVQVVVRNLGRGTSHLRHRWGDRSVWQRKRPLSEQDGPHRLRRSHLSSESRPTGRPCAASSGRRGVLTYPDALGDVARCAACV